MPVDIDRVEVGSNHPGSHVNVPKFVIIRILIFFEDEDKLLFEARERRVATVPQARRLDRTRVFSWIAQHPFR